MSYVHFDKELRTSITACDLIDTLNALAEKWGVPLESISLDSEYEYSYGDSVKTWIEVSAVRNRTQEEESEFQAELKKQQEKTRILKLEQLEKLQKELGIK